MKKKILICLQNPFMLLNIFETLGSLSKDSEITLITTNFLIDISDTSTIDFLIFNNAKYKLRDDFRYYLKNFDIKSLYNLK